MRSHGGDLWEITKGIELKIPNGTEPSNTFGLIARDRIPHTHTRVRRRTRRGNPGCRNPGKHQRRDLPERCLGYSWTPQCTYQRHHKPQWKRRDFCTLWMESAGPDEFRAAPLWGVGQRIFFLHDGRTTNLLVAIEAHRSGGSEANQIVERFSRISSISSDLCRPDIP